MKYPEEQGLILLYTGNGRGKITTALGTALRACGHGMRVAMVQLIKQLAGRHADSALIDLADMVSDVQEIKHHYANGIKGQYGIEF